MHSALERLIGTAGVYRAGTDLPIVSHFIVIRALRRQLILSTFCREET